MKKIFNLFAIAFLNATFAQVGIGTDTPHQSAVLELASNGNTEYGGVAVPHVALQGLTNPSPISGTMTDAEEGLLVFNTTEDTNLELEKGYYYWDGAKWIQWGNAKESYYFGASPDAYMERHLGYKLKSYEQIPHGSFTVTKPTTPPANINFERMSCKTWEVADGGNGHTYCTFKKSNGVAVLFTDGAALAEQIGGYIVTLTSTAETNFVFDNVINPSGTGTNPWNISYVKYPQPGNWANRKWMTGEVSRRKWDENPTAVEGKFWNILQYCPAFGSGKGNVTIILPSSVNTAGCTPYGQAGTRRDWNYVYHEAGANSGAPFTYVIIEFNR